MKRLPVSPGGSIFTGRIFVGGIFSGGGEVVFLVKELSVGKFIGFGGGFSRRESFREVIFGRLTLQTN